MDLQPFLSAPLSNPNPLLLIGLDHVKPEFSFNLTASPFTTVKSFSQSGLLIIFGILPLGRLLMWFEMGV